MYTRYIEESIFLNFNVFTEGFQRLSSKQYFIKKYTNRWPPPPPRKNAYRDGH